MVVTEYKDKNIHLLIKDGSIYSEDKGYLRRLTGGYKFYELNKILESRTRIYFISHTDWFYYDKNDRVIIIIDKEIVELFINNGVNYKQ